VGDLINSEKKGGRQPSGIGHSLKKDNSEGKPHQNQKVVNILSPIILAKSEEPLEG